MEIRQEKCFQYLASQLLLIFKWAFNENVYFKVDKNMKILL